MANELATQRSISERLEYLIWALSLEQPFERGKFDGLDERHLTTALERWFDFASKHSSPSSSNQRERNAILAEFSEIAPQNTPAGNELFMLVANFGAGLRYNRSDIFADYSIDELLSAYDDAAWWRTVFGLISELLTYGGGGIPIALNAAGRMLAAVNAARAAAIVSRAAGPAGWVVYGASVAATLAASRLYTAHMSKIEFEIEGNRIHQGEISAEDWDAFERTINDEFDDFSLF